MPSWSSAAGRHRSKWYSLTGAEAEASGYTAHCDKADAEHHVHV